MHHIGVRKGSPYTETSLQSFQDLSANFLASGLLLDQGLQVWGLEAQIITKNGEPVGNEHGT